MRITEALSRRFDAIPGPVRGALWMMASTAAWSGMAAIARYLTRVEGIHTFETVFFRSLFGMVFLLPWLFRVGLVSGLATQRFGMHMLRGLLGLGTIYLLFGAIAIAPLADISAIISTRPIFASALAILILHETASGRRWTAVILGLAGALLILRPGASLGTDGAATGVFMALAATGVMAALAIIIKSLAKTEKPDTIVTWQMLVFLPLSLLPALFVWKTPDLFQFVLLASTGLLGTMTQRCITRAYAAADATMVLPFDFTRLGFAALLGWVLFAHLPDAWTWAGGALIFAAVLWMARGEAKAARKGG
jgi:drug/metabolite transporter (DMT)-like permease